MVTDATAGNIISSASRRGFIDRKLRDWKFRAIATRYDKLQKIAYRRLILNQYCSLRSPKILLQQYRHST